MASNYTVALVGLGRIAWRGFGPGVETHAETIRLHPRLRLVASIDTDAMARADFQAKYGVEVYDRYVKADIAVICTPAAYHAAWVAAYTASDCRDILCEKPLSDSLAAAEGIVGACETFHKDM